MGGAFVAGYDVAIGESLNLNSLELGKEGFQTVSE